MPALNTLSKKERLKSRKTIDTLFKAGRSFSVFPFRVLYLATILQSEPEGKQFVEVISPTLQTGFSAPSKNFKKAVDRNRIKRLTKEAYRLNRHELQEAVIKLNIRLSLFLIYTGKELPDQKLVTGKISVILQALIKKLHESFPSNP